MAGDDRMDHDQRLKKLLKEFFADFLVLFFAGWAARLAAAAVEWLDKELFLDPPDGPKRLLDLLAKVPCRQVVPGQRSGEADHWLALIHIEVEAPDRVAPLPPRMVRAYVHLRDEYQLPVLPIGVFLKVGFDGIGTDVYEEQFWELKALRFEYLYVGLPALDAVEYVQGENPLGVALAALMKIPRARIAWLGAEALRRIQEAPSLTEQQRFLLGECVQAYLPLDEDSRREFEKLVATEPKYEGVRTMNATKFEQGMEQGMKQGMEKGLVKGQRELLREQLVDRFGTLPPTVEERLGRLPPEGLRSLAKAILHAQTLRDTGLED